MLKAMNKFYHIMTMFIWYCLVQGLQRLFSLRRYNGCIRFVPAPGHEVHGEPTEHVEVYSNGGPKSGYSGPSDVDVQKSNWRKIDGPFVSVWLHNVPWGSEDTMAAPDAKVICFHLFSLKTQRVLVNYLLS